MSIDNLYPFKGGKYPIRVLMNFVKFPMTPGFLSMRIRMNIKKRFMSEQAAVIEAINRDPTNKNRIYRKKTKRKVNTTIHNITFNNLHIHFKAIL